MKMTYDREVDILRILFNDAPIEESDEQKPGLILDYDKDGNVVGLEMLHASKRIQEPDSLQFALASATRPRRSFARSRRRSTESSR